MSLKRGKLMLFGVILLVLIIGFASAQESEEEGFFSNFLKGFRTMTGWITSFANVFLEIQTNIYAPENLTIYVLNQSTGIPTLNWSASNCAGYYIWYSDNVTEILQLNYNNTNETIAPNVTLEGKYNTTWDDTTAPGVQRRFYAVAAYVGNDSTTSDVKVGKWNVTINDETNIKQTFASTPLEQDISLGNITPPNNFAWAYAMNYTTQTWDYAYSSSGAWHPSSPLKEIEFERGGYFDKFNSVVTFTSAGVIPTGNVIKIIYAELNVTPTTLGWESFTNGNLSELVIPPNNFAWVYTVNDAADNDWLYAYSSSGAWHPSSPLKEFKPGKGYIFNKFNTETNFTYERNPY